MRGDGIYGVLTAGGIEVAISAAALQEVIPWPARIVPQLLPPAAARAEAGVAQLAMLGLFELRGMPIPAYDLRRLVEPDQAEAAERRGKIAILTTAKGRLGLAVDDIADVVRASPDAARRLNGNPARADAPLVSTVLALDDGARIVQLLDLDALLARRGVVTLAADEEATRQGGGNAYLLQYMFFECDDLRFCLEATAVREVLDGAVIDRSVKIGGLHHGMVTLRGRPIPVIDLFNVLALPGSDVLALPDSAQPKSKLLVLDIRGQTVAILVSALVAIHRLSPEHVMKLPAFGLKRPEFFDGVVAAEATGKDTLMLSQDAILLSHEAVMRDKDVMALHRLHKGLGEAREEATRRPSGVRTAWLGFAAGEPLSVPLAQIDEILRVPSNVLSLPSPDGVMLGFIKRRGAMLPLIDLRRLAGHAARPVDGYTRILLVRGPQTRFAFKVDNTVAVRHVFVGREMEQSTGFGAMADSILREATSLYLVQDAEGEHAMPLLDLARLAARLEAMPQAA